MTKGKRFIIKPDHKTLLVLEDAIKHSLRQGLLDAFKTKEVLSERPSHRTRTSIPGTMAGHPESCFSP